MTTYFVKTVYHSTAGIAVTVLVSEGGDTAQPAEFLIAPELWHFRKLDAGTPITEEQFFEIEHSAVFSRARARTKEILSYSGHSRRGLIAKLRHYGLPDEICEEAADWAIEEKMIKEEEQATLAAETYQRRKYWGKKRIVAELSQRGYPSEVISAAVDAIPAEDYMRSLLVLMERKFGTPSSDPAERQKMVLSLLHMGYTGQEIKDAIEQLHAKAEI